LFTLGLLAAGLSPSASVLVAARALQGLGAALAAPNALALLTVIAPECPVRARALGAFTAASAAGGSLGLVLGGALTSWVSWRAAFFVDVPVGVLVLALLPSHLHSPPGARGPVDLLGGWSAPPASSG
jgi:MFS family permease